MFDFLTSVVAGTNQTTPTTLAAAAMKWHSRRHTDTTVYLHLACPLLSSTLLSHVFVALHAGFDVFVAIIDAKAAVFLRHGRPGE